MAAKLPRCLVWLFAIPMLFLLTAARPAISSQAPKTVAVAIGEDYPPFCALDGQKRPMGWLVDVWRLWSQKTGIEVKFVAAPFGETLRLVRDGKVDVHGGCFYNKQRAEYLDYVAPIAEATTSFFFHKGIFGIRNVVDLAPFRIGVIKGDSAVAYLRDKLPEASLAEFETNEEMFTAIKSGEIRVFVADTPVGLYFLKKWDLLSDYSFMPDKPLYSSEFQAAVKKGDTSLAKVVGKGLAEITAAERMAIERRWSGGGVAKSSQKGVLIVAFERYNQPLSSLSQNGKPSGVLVDIWRLWASKTGNRVQFVFGSRSDTMDWVRNGKADIISGLVREPYMNSWLAFSTPLFTVHTGLFYRTQDGPIEPSELAGQNVGVLKDSFVISSLAKQYSGITFEQLANRKMLAKTLHRGEVRAVAAVAVSFNEILNHMGYSGDIAWSGHPLSIRSLRVGVSKNKPELLKKVNSGLAAISRQEIIGIEKRWVPDETMQHFANTGTAFELSEAERQWLDQRKTPVVAGAEMDWPPFDFVLDGKPAGYSNELLRLAAQKVGLPLKFVFGLSWAELVEKFHKGEIDILPAVYQTPERTREMAFTNAYVANPTVLVARADSPNIRNLDDLKGKRLAVIKGFSISRFLLENRPKIKQVFVKNVLEGLKAVSLDKADGFVGSLGVIGYILNENVIPNIRMVDEVIIDKPEATHLHMVTLKNRAILCSILQKGLNAVSPNELQRLKHRWLPISMGSADTVKTFALSPQDKKWLAGHPKIVMGVDPEWMPIEGINQQGVYQGVASGIVELIAKRLGVPLRPEPGLAWPQVLDKARKGEMDLLPAAMRTPQREKYLLFTKPYLSFPVVVVTRDDAPIMVDLESLKGKVVAIPADYASVELIKRDHPTLQLKPVTSIAQGLEQLDQGEADALVGNMASINFNLKKLGLKKLKIAATTEYKFDVAMAVRKDWPEFAAMVQRALNSLTGEEKAAITSQWINMRFAERIDWGFIARTGGSAAAVVLVILVVIIIWNRRMAREVAQRKQAEQRVASMVANVPGAIFQMDVFDDGRREYRYLSPRAEEFFGEPPEEIISQKRRLPWHPEDEARVGREIEAAIAENRDLTSVGRILLPDGTIKWVQINASAEKAGKGSRLSTGFILDVTARMQAEERFKAMAANVPGAIFQFTANTNGQAQFTYVSQRAEEFFGVPPAVIIAEKRLLPFHPEDKDRAIGEINQALSHKQKLNLVARIFMPNGDIAWIRVSATPARISDTEIAYNGFILNITERKQAEMEFIASERKIKAMSQAVEDALVMVDGEGKVLFWNPAAERLFGYNEAEAMGMDFHAMAAPEEYQGKIKPGLKSFATNGQGPVLGTTTEITARNRQGERFPVEVTLSSFQMEDKWYAVGTVRDISQRKMAEEAIKESEQRVRTILDSINTGIIIIDPENHTIFDANPVAVKMIGAAKQDIIGAVCHQFICPKAKNDCPITDHDQEIDNSERILLTADGSEVPVLKTVVPVKFGEKEYLLESFVDITERKQAEDALRESQGRLDMALAASNTGLWDWRPLDGQDFHNEQWFHQLGYTSQEFPPGSNPLMKLMHPDDAMRFEKAMQDYLTGGEDDYKQEFRMKAKDGSWKWILSLGKVNERDESGRVKRIIGVHLDMTERRQAEEDIKNSQRRMAEIIDFLPDPTLVIDNDDKVLFWNRSMERLTGISKENILGKGDHEYALPFYGERRPILVDLVRRWSPELAEQYLNIKKEGDCLISESFHPHLGEEGIYLSGTATLLYDAGGAEVGAIETLRDITESKKTEALMVAKEVAEEEAARAERARREAEEARKELQAKLKEIERFNRLALGREERIIELKRQANDLAAQLGLAKPYEDHELAEALQEQPARDREFQAIEPDAEMDGQRLAEVLSVEQFQALLNDFCQAAGIAAAIIDTQGEVLAAARWQRACTDFHRQNEVTCGRCIESDTELAAQLKEGKPYAVYQCKNGLTDAASPIIINGKHLANTFVGQFFTAPPDMEFFRRQAVEVGFDPEQYLAAVAEVPVADEKRLPNILGFLVGMSRMVASSYSERLKTENAEAAMALRADESLRERAAALSLAEDAEKARAGIEQYKGRLELLVAERTEELKLSEERSRRILDSAGEGIFGVDSQGRVTFVNPSAVHMLGFSEKDLLGQKVHDVIHHHYNDGSEYPLEDCPMWASYSKGEPHQIDDEVLWRKDGTSFPVEYASMPIAKDGRLMGAVVTFRDVSERREAEEELRRNLDELERFSRLTIGREERMIALKQEINDLLEKAGQDAKYRIVDQVDLQ